MLIRPLPYLLLLLSVPCTAADFPGIPQFVDEMVAKHGFKHAELTDVLRRAQRQQAVLDLISKPATVKPWTEYRAIFVNDRRIKNGVKFWQDYEKALQIAENEFGVPQEIIVAIIGVETLYGNNKGRFSVLDALTTLAFDYPRRSAFFLSELEDYLLLAREQEWELFKVQGSYAGAMGIPQFMPSSYRNYAVDFDNDDMKNLFEDPLDAIGSVANYLNQYGWKKGEPVAFLATLGDKYSGSGVRRSIAAWAAIGVKPVMQAGEDKTALLLDFTVADGVEYWLAFNNFQVITLYNNSNFYAMSVYQLAQALRSAKRLQ